MTNMNILFDGGIEKAEVKQLISDLENMRLMFLLQKATLRTQVRDSLRGLLLLLLQLLGLFQLGH